MNILGALATTPNNVSSINYFNYGYAGSGTGVESFLEYNGYYFGFCYSDTTAGNGTIITTSDEDWAWHNSSPELMENILYKLANSIVSSNHDPQTDHNALTIFPNPLSIEATVMTNRLHKNATMRIYNLVGQQFKMINKINSQTIHLNRDNMPTGLYIIRLEEDGKIIATNKLMVTDY
jgi:hypothetical protein